MQWLFELSGLCAVTALVMIPAAKLFIGPVQRRRPRSVHGEQSILSQPRPVLALAPARAKLQAPHGAPRA